jgi:hypothetical protein
MFANDRACARLPSLDAHGKEGTAAVKRNQVWGQVVGGAADELAATADRSGAP